MKIKSLLVLSAALLMTACAGGGKGGKTESGNKGNISVENALAISQTATQADYAELAKNYHGVISNQSDNGTEMSEIVTIDYNKNERYAHSVDVTYVSGNFNTRAESYVYVDGMDLVMVDIENFDMERVFYTYDTVEELNEAWDTIDEGQLQCYSLALSIVNIGSNITSYLSKIANGTLKASDLGANSYSYTVNSTGAGNLTFTLEFTTEDAIEKGSIEINNNLITKFTISDYSATVKDKLLSEESMEISWGEAVLTKYTTD